MANDPTELAVQVPIALLPNKSPGFINPEWRMVAAGFGFVPDCFDYCRIKRFACGIGTCLAVHAILGFAGYPAAHYYFWLAAVAEHT